METEIIANHSLFYKVRLTEVGDDLLRELYGQPNNKLGYGWDFETAWGEVTVIKDYETGEPRAWFVVCDSDTAEEAVTHTLDLIYEVS